MFSEILNLEGHLNRCIGSKVMAILLNGWILPTRKFIPKADFQLECPYYNSKKKNWSVLISILKSKKNGFPIVFSNFQSPRPDPLFRDTPLHI